MGCNCMNGSRTGAPSTLLCSFLYCSSLQLYTGGATTRNEKYERGYTATVAPSRSLSHFAASRRSSVLNPTRRTLDRSWNEEDDDDGFPIRPRTLSDIFELSRLYEGDPYIGGLLERESTSMSSTESSGSDPLPTDISFQPLTDDAEPQSFEDTPAADELRRQLAATLVIQDWTRSRFQPWLRQRGRRSRGGSLQAASESPSDEDFGAVMPTIVESSEIDTTGMCRTVRECSEHNLSGGPLAADASCETIEDRNQEGQSSVDVGKDQSHNSDTETTNRPATEAAMEQLRRQLAATRVVQEWTRTRFQPWLQERGPRLSGGSLQAVPVNSLDEDFGVVVATVLDSSEMDTTGLWHPGREYSEDDLSGGWLAAGPSHRSSETEEQVHQSKADTGKDQWSNLDLATNNRPASENYETEAAWSSDETTYARLPSRAAASVDGSLFISPRSRRKLDMNDDDHTQQLFVQLPQPFQRAPVDQLRPGSSSEIVFGELLRECKYGVPITFEAMLEDIGAEGCVKLCEGALYTEVFRTCGTRGSAVLKVFHQAHLIRHLHLLLTEVRIARSLRCLAMSSENSTDGFAELRA
ncbi:hypothetical protein MTO96_033464 [Rhipicephalus appendiculatus]